MLVPDILMAYIVMAFCVDECWFRSQVAVSCSYLIYLWLT